jgi:hypothetical protein
MNDITVFGLGFAAIVTIALVVVILALGYGAVCLHIAAKILKFKNRTFRKAFVANAIMLFAPPLGIAGSNVAHGLSIDSGEVPWPMIIAGLLGFLGWLIPIFVIQFSYKQPFGRSLVAWCIAGLIEGIIALALFFGIAIALISSGILQGSIG